MNLLNDAMVIFFGLLIGLVVISRTVRKMERAPEFSIQGESRLFNVGRVYKLKEGYHLTVVDGSEYVFVDDKSSRRMCGYHLQYRMWICAAGGQWAMRSKGFRYMSFDELIREFKNAGEEAPFLKVNL